METKALVLFSGGQDSTTALFWAQKEFDQVYAIAFDYGQSHVKEIYQAQKIARRAQVPFEVVIINPKTLTSSLTDMRIDHNEPHEKNSKLPASFTPGRNLLFITLAAVHAYDMDIDNLVMGVCQTDYSGYPDCRRRFIDSAEKTWKLATERAVTIHTPLMALTKAETWKLAHELGVLEIIRTKTLTDYNGDMEQMNDWGYGRLDNPASKLRAAGYKEAVDKGWIPPFPPSRSASHTAPGLVGV